jgi:hypothetical protein
MEWDVAAVDKEYISFINQVFFNLVQKTTVGMVQGRSKLVQHKGELDIMLASISSLAPITSTL